MRGSSTLVALLLVACGGEPRSPEPPPPGDPPEVRPVAEETTGEAQPAPRAAAAEDPPPEPAPDPFAAPLPEADCPDDGGRVAIAHRSVEGLPTWLERAVAFRSEDGRHLRIAVANHPIERDELGRFADPSDGEARFEMDATRTRRGALEPRVLGPPDSRRGGLTHARIVSPGPILTFGHRDVGRVELTVIADDHVCGRIDLDDGFARVRGAFRAPIAGPLPQ